MLSQEVSNSFDERKPSEFYTIELLYQHNTIEIDKKNDRQRR